uniref:ShKT domain-containing protein n=1 Tax=Caenorhabditis tropicalis TaxID=1561998 RepID=A0A1I7V253_9PELO
MIAVFLLLVAGVSAEIKTDLNCTNYIGDGTITFGYAPSATVCDNIISDASCDALYAPVTAGDYPEPGNDVERPFNCYTATGTTGGAFSADMKKAALESCPKSCGYCCNTNRYNCRNVDFPRLNCNTITRTQCNSPAWRTIIATDCPSACGFCNEGGCVDAVLDCANDLSICTAVGMQDFVNTYCQRTCQRCASTTAASSGTGSCTSFIADSSTSCRAWSLNGFCTNNFYTAAQRRVYCATTCRIC